MEDAIAHAGTLGYPVVLKRRFGFAGQGVAVVSNRDELAAAAKQLLRPDPLDLGGQREPRLLVQAYITGPCQSQALVALRGEPLACFGWERHVATNPVKGQTSVLRFVRSIETRTMSEVLCRGFGIAGFFNVQFVVDARTGIAYLLEINRRVVTHMHLGERVGRDLGRALLRALDGEPAEAPPAIDEDRRRHSRGLSARMAARSTSVRTWPNSRSTCPGTIPGSSRRCSRCGARSERAARPFSRHSPRLRHNSDSPGPQCHAFPTVLRQSEGTFPWRA